MKKKLGHKESDLRTTVLRLLRPLHAVPIESPMTAGIPDVNCSAGWIELKHLNVWTGGIVQPRHFEPEQRNFLRARCAHGGKAWLLLRAAGDWCLIWGREAADHLGIHWTAEDIRGGRTKGIICWHEEPTSADLIRALVIEVWV